jgi:acetylornithine/N-succinyldiaminopimelate aminotransferase
MLAKEGIEFEVGEHGSTFGGNPLACATALAAIKVIEAEKLVARSKELGEYFRDAVGIGSYPIVKELRGKGLMIAIELTKPCAEIVADALERGILINCTSNNVIRLVPPLVISKEELDEVISVLREIIK